MALNDGGRAGILEWRTHVGADHPALPGHFPGNPVVPGVVLITEVLRAARALIDPELSVRGLPSVKFLAPVLPGEPLCIVLEPQADGRVRFTVQRDSGERAESVATGLMQCDAATPERGA